MIEIYGSNGRLKCQLESGSSSQQDKALQSDNVLSLSFTHYAFLELDVNDWCDFEGERYWLQEKYLPNQKSEREWEYNVKLYGIESLVKRFLVLNNTDGEPEAVFTLTAPASEHVRLIVKAINDGMGHTTNWKVGEVLATENLTIDYEGTYCDEGLRKVAEAAGTEWWMEGETVNLCRCEHGEELTLRYGESLTSLDRDEADGVKFYTRLFPIGSSRNIDREKYGHTRLQLPGGAKYVDMNVEKYGVFHHFEQEAFSGIYPRRIGEVSSVRHEEVTDPDGNPFTIYYFQDQDLDFDPNDYEIGGLVKHVAFQSGELDGRDFEVNYHSNSHEFEIITIWPYDDDTQLPGGFLVPQPGDKYILWNIRMPDEYYGLAEQEFEDAVASFNQEHCVDASVYKCPIHSKWLERTNAQLYIGRRVRLESTEFFPETGYRKSRITRITRKVSNPCQVDVEISDAVSTGTMTKIEDSIHDIKAYAKEALGTLPDIIKSGDTTRPTDTNLYSARRTHKEFLSKTTADTAAELIHFAKGLDSGGFVPDSSGMGIYQDGDGNWVIEGDFFHVRKKLTAESVEVMHSSHIGGKLIASPGSLVVSRIEIPDGVAYYRCYFNTTDSEGNEIQNTIAVDDLAYCETFNLVQSPTGKAGNHYLWRRVIAVGADYIDLSASDCAAESDAPLVGDHITTLGNVSDASRQNAIVLAGAGSGNPYFRIYSGINTYVLPDPDVQLSPHGSWIKVRDKQGSLVRIDDLIESLEDQLLQASGQDDKQIVIWFGTAIPTMQNEPAIDWLTDDDRALHVKDIYYNKGYASTGGGRAYSFERHEEGGVTEYRWDEITDRDVLASLEAANRAQDTADGKRRVFVGVPDPPYDAGDMWVNAVWPVIPEDSVVDAWLDGATNRTYGHGEIFNNDIVCCMRGRVAGESFSVWDWDAAQEYTTSRIMQTASQIILSVTNLATGLESAGVHIDGESSEVRIVAGKTKFLNPNGVQVASFTADGLQSNKVQCLDDGGNKRVEVDAAGVRMYYPLSVGQEEPQVMKEEIFVFDTNGNVCGTETRYYNTDGSIKWRLDSAGVLSSSRLQEYWKTNESYVVEAAAMQAIFDHAKCGDHQRYAFTETMGHISNGHVSKFTSVQGNNETYNGMVAAGVIAADSAPGASMQWLTGWLLFGGVSQERADGDSGLFSRLFRYYENGVRSSMTLTCTSKGLTATLGELKVYFDSLGQVTDIDPLESGSGNDALPLD